MGASLTGQSVWPYAVYFFRPYFWLVAVATGLMLVSAALEALLIGLLLPILAALLEATPVLAFGTTAQWLERIVDLVPLDSRLARATAAFMLVGVVGEAVRFSTTMVTTHLSTMARHDISSRVYAHVLDADIRRIVQTPQGEWLHRVVMAPFQMTMLFTVSPLMVVQILRTLAVVALLVSMSAVLAAAGILLGASYYAATSYLGQRHLYGLGVGQVQASEVQTAVASEALSGFREIKVYDASGWMTQKFRAATEAYTAQAVRQTMLQHLTTNALGAVFVVLVCGAIMLTQRMAEADYTSWVPVMTVFITGLGRISAELAALGKCGMQVAGMLPFARVVKAELETPNPICGGPIKLMGPPQSIEFQNVSYTHAGRQGVLSKVSFSATKGHMVAIVGASGSGKSTLIDLLLGLYEPDEGMILIDGRDLRAVNRTSWHAQIGYVGQEAFLFHASIGDNIAIGRAITPRDVEDAARAMHVHELEAVCGQGGEAVLGDRGGRLSGGQRQRVALARALAARPSVLVVDEATSNLESEAEEAIMRTLRQASRHGVLFVVAHRLSAVRDADQIVVLDHGRVAEIGTHEVLLRNCGVYCRLWQAQGRA